MFIQKTIRHTQCYKRKFLVIARSLLGAASNNMHKKTGKWLSSLNVKVKDDVTKEAIFSMSIWTDADANVIQDTIENAKRLSLECLLAYVPEKDASAKDISSMRKCNDLIDTSNDPLGYFYGFTFAEVAFVYETLFCDIDRSLYSKALVNRLAGKELDTMQLECKRAFTSEKNKIDRLKQVERNDIETWYEKELRALNKAMVEKKAAVRKEISEKMQAFMKSIA